MTARYDAIGVGYATTRRADPRIEAQVHAALGDARTIVNVGAGTGSYEPADRAVVALDPSDTMLRQRPPGAAPAVTGVAEALPFPDGAFAAAMAMITVHHWSDAAAGLREMARVARRQVVLLCEVSHTDWMWLTDDYFPGLPVGDTSTASAEFVTAHLRVRRVEPVPIPSDCTDGFGGAYWARPEAYLDPAVRDGISLFRLAPPDVVASGAARLAAELADGTWDATYGQLRTLPSMDLGYRLVIAGE